MSSTTLHDPTSHDNTSSTPASAGTPPPAVERLRQAVQDLLSTNPEMLGQFALVGGLEELLAAETQLRAVQTDWLRSAEDRDAVVEVCGRSPRGWLIEEKQLDAADAGRRIKLARTLTGFPRVRDAFRAARITANHASAIIAALLPLHPDDRDVVETGLMAMAGEMPPFALSRAVEGLLDRLGVSHRDPEARRQRRLAQRGLDWDRTFDGHGAVTGTLSPEVYDAGDKALAAAGAYTPAGPEDDRTPRQRRHDALAEIFSHFLATADLPDINGERPRVVVTSCACSLLSPALDTLHGERWQTHDGWGTLDSGLPVPPETVRRLACDSQLLPVRLDGNGDVLDLGRSTRVFSRAIRRAAWMRDKGRCTFPKCSRRPVELHHILEWARGGATSLTNAAWLCAFHHWLVHEGNWTLRRDHERRYVFSSPDGREFGHPPRHT